MNYRPEIDGLRALAVIPVILFHAGFELFSGGFVGVDIFFVISGYLITAIILDDLGKNRFDVLTFYGRRARRLLPALLLVIIAALPLAWALLGPRDMTDFVQSIVAAITFSSNLLFWYESGYFSAAAELKPLLHTWSLGVEAQFYLAFPLLMIAATKWYRKALLGVLVLIFIASFVIAQRDIALQPMAAFYLLPARAWQLMLGAFCAIALLRWPHTVNQTASNLLPLAGVLLIGFAIFSFDHTTPIPGLPALVPCLGAALIIVFTQKHSLAGKALSNALLVKLGLASYSIYLWHYPLFAFYRHGPVAENAAGYLALAALAILLGYLSYKFVETPFRSSQMIKTKPFIAAATISGVCLIGFSFIGYQTGGFAQRSHTTKYASLVYDTRDFGYLVCPGQLTSGPKALNYCHQTAPESDALIIGDSHAEDKFHGISNAVDAHNWMLLGNTACPPILEVEIVPDTDNCAAKMSAISSFVAAQSDIETIVLSFAHFFALDDNFAADHIRDKADRSATQILDSQNPQRDKASALYNGLSAMISNVHSTARRIIIAIDVPELDFTPRDCLRGVSTCAFNRGDVMARQALHRTKLAELAKQFPKIELFDPLDVFCQPDQCSILSAGDALYRDSHHLSLAGSAAYGAAFADWYSSKSP